MTANSAVRNIDNILKAIGSDHIADLLSGEKIRDIFLGTFCKNQGYVH